MGAVLLDRPAATPGGQRRTARRAPIDRQLTAARLWAEDGQPIEQDVWQQLVDAGIAPMRGGAQGLNPAVFMNNVPAPGSYAIDQASFNLLTERNDVPNPADAWPGFGGRIDHKVANVGVLANLRLEIALQLVVSGTGAVTSLYGFPWNLLKNVYLNANGGSSLIRCQGMDLRARRCRIFRNPIEQIATSPGMDTTATINAGAPFTPIGRMYNGVIANGTYTITFIVDLPIVHDPASLTGALFAQTDQNYLNYVIETCQQADVFTVAAGGAVAITGTVVSQSTFFSIPTRDANNGRVVVLPQAVTWLHEFIATDNPFANQGDVDTPLVRNNGQLLCLYQYIDNGGAAAISPMALNYIQWIYAANQVPRNYQPWHLMEENQRLYDGFVAPSNGAPYYLLDFEAENWQRDGVYPRGLSELKSRINIPGTVTVNANAHVHQVQETLTTG